MTGKSVVLVAATAAIGFYVMRVVRNVSGAQEGSLSGDLMQIGGLAGGLLLAPKVLRAVGV